MKNKHYSFCFLAIIIGAGATQAQVEVRPVQSQYNTSAPPKVAPGIQYEVQKLTSNTNTPYDYDKCVFSWTLTNGKEAYSNSSNPVKVADKYLHVEWDNINGNAKAKVVITNNGPKTCPLLSSGGGSLEREITVPIQYFEPLELIRLNGSPITSANLNCGINSVTLSVPAPQTTNPTAASINYNWAVTNGTITSGQGTNTIQVTPSNAQQMQITLSATRNDNSFLTHYKQATITRPTPTTPIITNPVNPVCVSSATATANASNATGYEWTSTGGVLVNGSQNTGVISASVGINASASGTYSVRAYSSACQTYSNPVTISPFFGPVTLQIMKYGTAGTGVNNTVFTVNSVSPYTWYIVQTNEPSGSLSWNPNNPSVNGYVSGAYEYRFNLNPGQTLMFSPVSASNNCGSATRNPAFTTPSSYRIAPNPVTTKFRVEFDYVDYWEALPEQLELFSEKSTKAIRSVEVREVFENKSFKNNNAIEFDVKDLPRGIYYLHVVDSKREEREKLKSIRLLLE